MAIGLFLAIIVNQKIRGQTFFRGAYYFPAIASSAAITILWIFIVSPSGCSTASARSLPFDLLGDVVRVWPAQELDRRPGHGAELGDHPQRLDDLGHVHAVLPRLAPVDQRQVYEAAAIDGAERLADVPAHHLPACCARATIFVATVAVIGALQLFDQAAIAGGPNGDPNNALMTVVLYLYNAAFAQFNFGYAAAVGVILFVVIFGVTLIQRRLFGQCPLVVSRTDRRGWRPSPAATAARAPPARQVRQAGGAGRAACLPVPDRLCAADVRARSPGR